MRRQNNKNLSRYSPLVILATIIWLLLERFILAEPTLNSIPTFGESLQVHFIDVGQGDAILIQSKDAAMLIDAGENNMGEVVVEYLQTQGIQSLDYVIGTHPHSDHIGGLDVVIDNLEVNKVILPDKVHTTKTFEDVIDAIDEKNLTITKPMVGTSYSLGAANFTIIAPNRKSYSNLNDYSVGIKLTYGEHSFLMVGDAEVLSENEILNNGINLASNVLKISHHGSSTSSSKEFIDAIDPEYAVITVGANDYGHPHKEIIADLTSRKIPIYRTDEDQTIIFTTDGTSLTVTTTSN